MRKIISAILAAGFLVALAADALAQTRPVTCTTTCTGGGNLPMCTTVCR